MFVALSAALISVIAGLERCITGTRLKKCKSLCFDCELAASQTRSGRNSVETPSDPTVKIPRPSGGSFGAHELSKAQMDELRAMVVETARLAALKKSPVLVGDIALERSARSATSMRNARASSG